MAKLLENHRFLSVILVISNYVEFTSFQVFARKIVIGYTVEASLGSSYCTKVHDGQIGENLLQTVIVESGDFQTLASCARSLCCNIVDNVSCATPRTFFQ